VVLPGDPVLWRRLWGRPQKETYFGFDKNEYPGDNLLPALHRSFSYTGYWLNNPPGRKQQWLDRQARHPQGERFRLHDPVQRAAGCPADRQGCSGARPVGRRWPPSPRPKRRALPQGAILFLDQEEGGRLLPEQSAYLFAWIEAIRASQYKPGVYCSGIPVPDGSSKISTARDILSHEGNRPLALWVERRVPTGSRLRDPQEALAPASSGISASAGLAIRAIAPQEFARQCAATYAPITIVTRLQRRG
jgi:hypothetical protein